MTCTFIDVHTVPAYNRVSGRTGLDPASEFYSFCFRALTDCHLFYDGVP